MSRASPRQDLLPVLRPANGSDRAAILALLEQSALPTADLASSQPDFVIACDRSGVVGAGALQRLGDVALLRSLAVSKSRRGTGLGRAIVEALEQRARDQGIAELVLLTETAQAFFELHSYRVTDRRAAPAPVQQCDQFRTLCPQSAVYMSKRL